MKLTKIKSKHSNKSFPFNRPTTFSNKLHDSMRRNGFTTPITLVKATYGGVTAIYIADGEHRLKVANFLEIDAYGIIVDRVLKTDLECILFVADLNNTQKGWGIGNYVNAFVYSNNKNYAVLENMVLETGYSYSTLAIMLHGSFSRRSGEVKYKVCTGKFQVRALKNTNKVLDFAKHLSKVYKLTNRMLLALYSVMISSDSFNKSLFEKNYKKNILKVKELSLDDYTKIFKSWT